MEWDATPLFRFNVKLDGVSIAGFPITQSDDVVSGVWPANSAGKTWLATVEGSIDAGLNWSAPVPAEDTFLFPSSVITPSVIPNGTATRTSGSGVLPMLVDIASEVYDSYQREIRIYDADGNETYQGFQAVSASDQISPFAVDLTGATDPAPVPDIPALNLTDFVKMRHISADYMEGAGGVAQNWMVVSPTNTAGKQFTKFTVTDSTDHNYAVVCEAELALAVGGPNVASGRTYTFNQPSGGGGNFDVLRMFDGNQGTVGGGSLPFEAIIDHGIPVDLHQLRMTVHTDYGKPTNFTIAFSADGVTWDAPALTVVGATWTTVGPAGYQFQNSWSW